MSASPPINRDLASLHPLFRAPFEAWLAEATDKVRHVEFRVTETHRTLERQAWLYAQGRTPPHDRSPRVTWTLGSRHRWGLAADIAMIRRATGEAIWEVSSWKWLLRTVPPEPFGLRNLAPLEFIHFEYRYAAEAIDEAAALGLTQA